MNSSLGLSFTSVAMFLFLASTQVLTVSLLPRTAGFTDPNWTIACLVIYSLSLWSLAYMIHAGMPLSLLLPILAAALPLATIAVGVTLFHETASALKIALLCAACGIIGLASAVK